VDELFDLPARWRGDAILALALQGDERIAAASPGAGFPTALRSLAVGLQLRAGDVVVELGAGLGGVAAWLRSRTGCVVHAVEPAVGSRSVASELFPELEVHGDVDELRLPPGTVDAVVLAGVISLVPDADALVATAAHLLRPGGRLGITDVVPLDRVEPVIVSGPNVVRTTPVLVEQLARHGFGVTHVGHGPCSPSPQWQAVADRVQARVRREHADAHEMRLVEQDQAHLSRLGVELGLGCVVVVATRHLGADVS
jgi:SAM-dependent methyltransferase